MFSLVVFTIGMCIKLACYFGHIFQLMYSLYFYINIAFLSTNNCINGVIAWISIIFQLLWQSAWLLFAYSSTVIIECQKYWKSQSAFVYPLCGYAPCYVIKAFLSFSCKVHKRVVLVLTQPSALTPIGPYKFQRHWEPVYPQLEIIYTWCIDLFALNRNDRFKF